MPLPTSDNSNETVGTLQFSDLGTVGLLCERNLTLAVAESCTGGLLAGCLTSVAGSSACFKGGVVAYCNSVKTSMLGVPGCLLERYGAVSGPVASAMTEGVRQRLNSDISLATTGIAGPGGGSPQKPIGLVYIALAVCRNATIVRECRFSGNRAAVRAAAVTTALQMLHAELKRL